MVYRDNSSSFKDFSANEKSVKIVQCNLQLLSTEIFKNKAGLHPEIMNEIVSFSKHPYNFRKTNILKSRNVSSIKHGKATLCYFDPKIWNQTLNEYKQVKYVSISQMRKRR